MNWNHKDQHLIIITSNICIIGWPVVVSGKLHCITYGPVIELNLFRIKLVMNVVKKEKYFLWKSACRKRLLLFCLSPKRAVFFVSVSGIRNHLLLFNNLNFWIIYWFYYNYEWIFDVEYGHLLDIDLHQLQFKSCLQKALLLKFWTNL